MPSRSLLLTASSCLHLLPSSNPDILTELFAYFAYLILTALCRASRSGRRCKATCQEYFATCADGWYYCCQGPGGSPTGCTGEHICATNPNVVSCACGNGTAPPPPPPPQQGECIMQLYTETCIAHDCPLPTNKLFVQCSHHPISVQPRLPLRQVTMVATRLRASRHLVHSRPRL